MNNELKIPKVSEIVMEKVIFFNPDQTVMDVVRIFNEYRISSAPVIKENNEVVGFISESDTMKYLGNTLFFDDSKNNNVDSIMSKKILTAKSDWDIFELENFFIEQHIRSAPVVDSSGHLLGIVTRRDALISLQKMIESRSEQKRHIKEPIKQSMHQKLIMKLDYY